jgi:cell division protein FtsB
LAFFDSNNIFTNKKTREKLNELKKEKQFYLDEIRKDSVQIQKLLYDTDELEKFGREKFLMKKPGEDVYLLLDTTADQRQ